MNKTVIKEIKSIYSGRIKSQNPVLPEMDIKSIKTNKTKKSFFTGVIEKLNIITPEQ